MAEIDWNLVNPIFEGTEEDSFDLFAIYTPPIPPSPLLPPTVESYSVSYVVNPYYTCTAELDGVSIQSGELIGLFPVGNVGWIEERGGIRHDVDDWNDVPFGKYIVDYSPSSLSTITEVVTCTANLSDGTTDSIDYNLIFENDRDIGRRVFLQRVSEATG